MMKRLAGGLAMILAAHVAPAQRPQATEHMVPAHFGCDGINYTGRLDPGTLAELEPAHSLEAVAAILTRRNVPFTRNRETVDVPAMPAKILASISTLPQGEPFILPADGERGTICVLIPSADSI